jgi:dTDP-4-dehydrorhamnose reductase
VATANEQSWALIGAGGQLGQELCVAFGSNVTPVPRESLDLARPEMIGPVLEQFHPRGVISCAAYNHVDRAESEAQAAFAVNALGVRELARCCRALDCPLVHFSTDHVFGLDVGHNRPYQETDTPGPASVYGASKLAGEYFARALCPKHYVIRTCGLYGHRGSGGKGTNFVEAILRRARTGAGLRVVDDQRCTPTSAADLARAVAPLIDTGAYGLYHITNSGSCTWFEFAAAILAEADMRVEVQPISSAAYAAAARRPGYSVLDCNRYDRLGLAARRPWREALAEYLRHDRPPAVVPCDR